MIRVFVYHLRVQRGGGGFGTLERTQSSETAMFSLSLSTYIWAQNRLGWSFSTSMPPFLVQFIIFGNVEIIGIKFTTCTKTLVLFTRGNAKYEILVVVVNDRLASACSDLHAQH